MNGLPSLDMVRSLTDETVLRHLMAVPVATRAEIAARSGISKTTISESMRRLAAARFVVDTGERSSGPGRAGSYYSLAAELGVALVVGIGPEGIVAEVVTVFGSATRVAASNVKRSARPATVRRVLSEVVQRALSAVEEPVRLVVVSAADPVERSSGTIVQLPDAPFPVGELSPAESIHHLIAVPVTVDNDVNWAAVAERSSGMALSPDEFAYVFLGEGLGCALVSDGAVVRGHRGLAGEIAHVLTTGPSGEAMPFIEVFDRLDLRHRSSTAIDTARLLDLISVGTRPPATLSVVAAAVAGVLIGIVAFADPGEIVLGGAWGSDSRVVDAVQRALETMPRRVQIRGASVADSAALVGARLAATESLQTEVVSLATTNTSRSPR